MKRFWVVLMMVGVIVANAGRIPVEDFFRPPAYSNPALSPDGKHVACCAHEGWRGGIGVVELGTGKLTMISSSRDEAVSWVQWVTNDRLIFGASERQHALGGLYAVNRDGKQFRELIPSLLRQARRNFYELGTHSLLHVSTNGSGTILIAFNKLFDGEGPGVFRMDTSNGKRVRLESCFGNVRSWEVDHAGNVRIAVAVEKDSVDYYHRPVGGTKWERIFRATLAGESFEPAGFDWEGRNLYVVSNRGGEFDGLHLFDPAKPGFVAHLFTPTRHDLMEGFMPLLGFSASARGLATLAYEAERPALTALLPAAAQAQRVLDGLFPDAINRITDETVSGQLAIVASWSDVQSPVFYLYDRERKKLSALGISRPWLKPPELATMRPIRFTARDGLELEGYLTLPPDGLTNNLPMILLPHGGPWVRDVWGFDPEVQFLANRGYAVLQVNFRGSRGYGSRLFSAGFKEWGAKMQDDLTDSVRWAVRQQFADPERIGIYGASYGGYAAMAGLCFTPELYRCGVNLCGVTDMRRFMDGIPQKQPLKRKNMERLVGDPKEESESMKSRSPLFNAEKIVVPVLIAHGADDQTVPLEHSERLYKLLRKRRQEVKFIVKRDEGHGFVRRSSVLDYYGELEMFLDQHLKNAKPRSQ